MHTLHTRLNGPDFWAHGASMATARLCPEEAAAVAGPAAGAPGPGTDAGVKAVAPGRPRAWESGSRCPRGLRPESRWPAGSQGGAHKARVKGMDSGPGCHG